MSIFRELLQIKSFREGRAELAVIAQRQSLTQAQGAEDAARTGLIEYTEFATRREATLYRELCSRIVGLRDLEDLQSTVAELRQHITILEKELEEASRQRTVQADLLSQAQDAHRVAMRIKQKFVELELVYADELAIEVERKEDLELEEVSGVGNLTNAWNSAGREAAS